MIDFPTALGKPLLSSDSSAAPLSFTRSEFDYGVRQRKSYKGYDKSGFSIILAKADLATWLSFWDDINEGADAFHTDFFINGSDNVYKILRFSKAYTLTNLGNLKFLVKCSLEIVDKGYPFGTTFLLPTDTLYPSETLLPT